MGKCNLFAPISQSTGNFLLFSQYAEDMTKSANSEDYYRVVPSKYILLNLNAQSGWDAVKYSEYFQNYYENACSIMREKTDWNPEYASILLWRALTKDGVGFIDAPTEDEGSTDVFTSPSVVHIGDINITSDNQVDGVNYNEIYIDVPQNSKRQKLDFTKFAQGMSRIVSYPDNYINGYPDESYPTAGTEPWPSNHIDISTEYYDGTDSEGFLYEMMMHGDFNMVYDSAVDLDDEKYDFNCIIVLYDIHKRSIDDGTISAAYTDIPMGMYFTGAPGDDGEIQNPVTVWVSNDDIYQQGTSYGFRICTRYLSTQNSLYIIDSSIEAANEMYSQYATVMSKIGESQVIMNQISQKMSEYQNNITSHLANVKNYKVNVPYVREIGGKQYWFVNGKNLGVAVHQTNLVWENY